MKIRFSEQKLIRNWMLGASHVTFYAENGHYYVDMLRNFFEVIRQHGRWVWDNWEGEDEPSTIYEYVDGADEIMDWVEDWMEANAWRGGDPALEEG